LSILCDQIFIIRNKKCVHPEKGKSKLGSYYCRANPFLAHRHARALIGPASLGPLSCDVDAGTEFLQAGARATALGLQLARPVRCQSAGARMKIARKYFKLIFVSILRYLISFFYTTVLFSNFVKYKNLLVLVGFFLIIFYNL